jgi:2-dehydro-3-deoxyphosphogluconate aldolase/(4S)-4-hydroxy-2-oxoglutarate aldolase
MPLARALVAGGTTCWTITLHTLARAESAQPIHQTVEGATIGLGAVLTPRDLAKACELGLRFAFSPCATPELLTEARRGAPDLWFIPAVQTASELMLGLNSGFSTCKFFQPSLQAPSRR